MVLERNPRHSLECRDILCTRHDDVQAGVTLWLILIGFLLNQTKTCAENDAHFSDDHTQQLSDDDSDSEEDLQCDHHHHDREEYSGAGVRQASFARLACPALSPCAADEMHSRSRNPTQFAARGPSIHIQHSLQPARQFWDVLNQERHSTPATTMIQHMSLWWVTYLKVSVADPQLHTCKVHICLGLPCIGDSWSIRSEALIHGAPQRY